MKLLFACFGYPARTITEGKNRKPPSEIAFGEKFGKRFDFALLDCVGKLVTASHEELIGLFTQALLISKQFFVRAQ